MSNPEILLEAKDVKKAFPGVQALRGVDFQLRRGEVHALVGENGAGKSTLMKILMGIYTKDSGDILLNGKKIEIHSPEEAHKYGIGMIFQELSLVPQLNVAENIFLGNEPKAGGGFLRDKEMYRRTRELMEKYNVAHYFGVRDKIGRMGRGFCQIVEVLKALSQDAKILIMDEPTASLTKEEEDTLYQIILNLKSEGVSIVYISHRLEEIFRNCDRVTVFRDGAVITTTDISSVTMAGLIEYMTGRSLAMLPHGEKAGEIADGKKTLLSVKNLKWRQRLKNVSFHVNYGEVVGVTGLMGSGKTETSRAIFGIQPADEGELEFEGKKIVIKSPSDAIKAGMALVPEDRRNEGLVLMHSVEQNISLPLVKTFSKAGWFGRRKAAVKVAEQIQALGIKTPSPRQLTKNLSGGNQQKVVVGKWLTKEPKLLILDEPTVGVDVKTKAELREIIQNLVKDKKRGVVLFSSELNEIIQLSDRIVILYRGEVIKEFSNAEPIQEEVLHRAIQGIIA